MLSPVSLVLLVSGLVHGLSISPALIRAAAAHRTLPAVPMLARCGNCRASAGGAPPPEKEAEAASVATPEKEETLTEAFDAGIEFGADIRARFAAPVIDDPGLPYADSLVCGDQQRLNPAPA